MLRGENHVSCLLRDHVDGADDKKPWDARKDRRIDHAEPFRAMHAEMAVDHSATLAWPDRASAGGVVTPRVRPDVILQLVIALSRVAGQFLLGYEPLGFQLCRQFPRKADARDNRVEVLARSIVTLLEIVEINQRRVSRVIRTQHDLTGAVLGVCLQDRPGQIIRLGYSE